MVVSSKAGIIIPQVISMGIVTRCEGDRANWLTASKEPRRLGTEVDDTRASGLRYCGRVDSEELWISSVMGDAQFGLRGATALGWMTLESTKVARTGAGKDRALLRGTATSHTSTRTHITPTTEHSPTSSQPYATHSQHRPTRSQIAPLKCVLIIQSGSSYQTPAPPSLHRS